MSLDLKFLTAVRRREAIKRQAIAKRRKRQTQIAALISLFPNCPFCLRPMTMLPGADDHACLGDGVALVCARCKSAGSSRGAFALDVRKGVADVA